MSTSEPLHSLTDPPVEPPSPTTEMGPVAASRRIDTLDILRGFALIGILMMNIEWFNRPIVNLGSPDFDLTGIDHAAGFFVMLFVQGKFYKLFSLLFGMGFALMLTRAQDRGQPFTAVFIRRMVALWLFGVIHLVFFWGGDILHDYAFGGLLMLGWVWLMGRGFMRRFNNPTSKLRFGLIFMSFPFIAMTIAGTIYGLTHDYSTLSERVEERTAVIEKSDALYAQAKADGVDLAAEDEEVNGAGAASGSDDATGTVADSGESNNADTSDEEATKAESKEDNKEKNRDDMSPEERIAEDSEQRAKGLAHRDKLSAEETTAFTDPSFTVATRYRLSELSSHLSGSVFFATMILFPIFVLGYWLVVTGRIRDAEQYRGFFKTLMYVGLGIGLPISIAAMTIMLNPAARWINELRNVGGGLFQISQYVLAAGYLGLIVTMVLSPFWRRLLMWLAPLGRMALTNYLTHTVILTTIFYGYGFGQFGHIPRGQQMLIVVAIIAVQWMFCTLWLKAFRFGPLEWIWRCVTYWKLQPLRRAAQA